MLRWARRIVASCCLCLPPLALAGEAFLKMDMVPGEAADPRHRDEIVVIGFKWAVKNAGAAARATRSAPQTAGATGKIAMEGLEITKPVDRSSPKLLQLCATGQLIPQALLTVRRPGASPAEPLRILLKDVVVTSLEQSEETGAGAPVEVVTLAATAITVEYRPVKADGTLGPATVGGFDFKAGKGIP